MLKLFVQNSSGYNSRYNVYNNMVYMSTMYTFALSFLCVNTFVFSERKYIKPRNSKSHLKMVINSCNPWNFEIYEGKKALINYSIAKIRCVCFVRKNYIDISIYLCPMKNIPTT